MTRVLLGFAIGAAAGTLLGMLNGASIWALRALDPSIQALRAIPSIAWVPLFILWLGIFETSKLALIALGVFFPVYLGILTAIQSVDRKLIEVGRVFGLSRVGIALRIIPQMPDDKLETEVPNRPRSYRVLSHHIFRIAETFLEVAGGEVEILRVG